jgi:hypothetical protein
MPRYLPPFSLLKKTFSMSASGGKIVANIDYDDLLAVVRLLLRGLSFDEDWYLARYPDVAEALASGQIQSAKGHFIENGYFEGRLPFPLDVDEAWYAEEYPDIGEAIARGEISSATAHFREFGYLEGRLSGDINQNTADRSVTD